MRAIKNWAFATFILCFLVILAGAVVRTTQSGMGCPDWPKCFGRWIPPTDASQLPPDFEKYLSKQDIDHSFNVYHTWIEYFNRLLGVLLGVFAIIQLWLLFKHRQNEKIAWRLAIAFLSLVILTGLFGAVVVKLNLAHLSISIHLLFAIVLVQVQLALIMTLNRTHRTVNVTNSFNSALWVLLVLLLLQAATGTAVRMHVDDISKLLGYSQREQWLADAPSIFIIHRSFSWLLMVAAMWLVWKGRSNSQLKKYLYSILAVLIVTMLIGIVLYYAHMPAFAQPIHLVLASVAITQAMHILFRKTI